jgi:hypothetical protein
MYVMILYHHFIFLDWCFHNSIVTAFIIHIIIPIYGVYFLPIAPLPVTSLCHHPLKHNVYYKSDLI